MCVSKPQKNMIYIWNAGTKRLNIVLLLLMIQSIKVCAKTFLH